MNVCCGKIALTLLLALSFSSVACTVRKQDWGKSEKGKKEFADQGEGQSEGLGETLFSPESFVEDSDDAEVSEKEKLMAKIAESGGAIVSEATGICTGVQNSLHPISSGKGAFDCLLAYAASEITEGVPSSNRVIEESHNLRDKQLVLERDLETGITSLRLSSYSAETSQFLLATFNKENSVNTTLNGRLTFNTLDLNSVDSGEGAAAHTLVLVERNDQEGLWKLSEIRRITVEAAQELLTKRDTLADPVDGRVTLFSNSKYIGTLEALILEKESRGLMQSIGGQAAPENGEIQSIQSVARKYAAGINQTQIIVPRASEVGADRPLISYQMSERLTARSNVGGEMATVTIDTFFGADEDDKTTVTVESASTEGFESQIVSQTLLDSGYLMTVVSQDPDSASESNQVIISLEILPDIILDDLNQNENEI